MAFKPRTYTKEINGNIYTAQFNGLEAALDAADTCVVDGTDRKSSKKMTAYILKNVIVDPAGLQINDFENASELGEVIKFGSQVMGGDFRPDADESKAE